MTPASAAARLADEQLPELSGPIKDAHSVELKLRNAEARGRERRRAAGRPETGRFETLLSKSQRAVFNEHAPKEGVPHGARLDPTGDQEAKR
jgi:hypothetical protein